ncbi:MAG: hypothetical protein C4530_04190 [Desulfobacteraceae bacterium]|nr:MAG: hypothetical protein C4530_04190 [Desulfobacteraceae bacterium]
MTKKYPRALVSDLKHRAVHCPEILHKKISYALWIVEAAAGDMEECELIDADGFQGIAIACSSRCSIWM